jgi:hypothetical protein
MAKIDLDSLNIEELAALRDAVTDKLAQKVMARQAELEAAGKPKKGDEAARKIDEAKNTVAKDAVAKDAVAKAA